MIKYLLNKFGYVIVKKKIYDELIYNDNILFESEEYKKERRERFIKEYTRKLFLKKVENHYTNMLYLDCRKIAEHLADMESIDWTK